MLLKTRLLIRGAACVNLIAVLAACCSCGDGSTPTSNLLLATAPSVADPSPVVIVVTATAECETGLFENAPTESPTSLSVDDVLTLAARETPPVRDRIDPLKEAEAAAVLDRFLFALYLRQYSDAAMLYGGNYDQLWEMTRLDASPDDFAAIWASVCDRRKLQCMPVKTITAGRHTETSFEYLVEFANPDGSTFSRGPCCGGNATDQPPVSEFAYSVIYTGEHYLVVGVPPYVP